MRNFEHILYIMSLYAGAGLLYFIIKLKKLNNDGYRKFSNSETLRETVTYYFFNI